MSAAHHTLLVLAALPLPPAQRRDLLDALHRAAGTPPPPHAVTDRLLAEPAHAARLPPTQRAALEAALSGPHVSETIQEALAGLTGHRSQTPPPPPPRHPLGPGAPFPARIAVLTELRDHIIRGAPRPLRGFPFGGPIVGFREALRRPRPARAVILGGGYVGVEMAQGWASAGTAVTLIERRRDLLRGYIPAVAQQAHQLLSRLQVSVQLGHHATGWDRQGAGVVLYTRQTVGEEGRVTGPVCSWPADLLLVAAGVMPPSG